MSKFFDNKIGILRNRKKPVKIIKLPLPMSKALRDFMAKPV